MVRLNHDLAERVFNGALDLPPRDRKAWLDEQCAGQDDLRRTVLALLDAHESSEGLLDEAVVGGDLLDFDLDAQEMAQADRMLADADLQSAVFAAGTRIGEFEIASVLGFGGMGVVYVAEQAQPHRRVALKVLQSTLLAPSARRRFDAESEIMARLRHPNIAQVLAAGTHHEERAEYPWFAMELVVGARPLTKYAAENGLDLPQRLELFVKVCDAIDHGASKGVVHRDLKPENILVDKSGEPKVIDFGVARITDADVTLATAGTTRGEFLGTLQYMSPEQCEADPDRIDARSDVYSLGVLLYELLCDAMPYDLRDLPIPRVLHVISTEPPRRPSRLRPELRGELEAVILQALSKSPRHRYSTAGEVRDEIQRHLRGEPTRVRSVNMPRRVLALAASRSRWIGTAVVVFAALVWGALAWMDRDPSKRSGPTGPVVGKLVRGASCQLTSVPTGAAAWLRPIDPDSGQPGEAIPLGVTPVEEVDFEALGLQEGMHRLVFVDSAGEAEQTRFFESDRTVTSVATLHPTSASTEGMILIPAGTRKIRAHIEGGAEWRDVPVEPFWIDRHEVTNAEYRAFAEASGYSRPWYLEDDRYDAAWDALPAVFIDFDQARAFAEWHGKRLPTRLEWALAALGDSGEHFPSGISPDNLVDVACVGRLPSDRKPDTKEEWLAAYVQFASAPGSHAGDRGPSGVMDVAGNVCEWVETLPIVASERGEVRLNTSNRAAMGLDWRSAPRHRIDGYASLPASRIEIAAVGFRCARSDDPLR